MKQNTRKALALLIAGAMIVTGFTFTSNNVLKAADPNAASTEQALIEGSNGVAETAPQDKPEVVEEKASLNDGGKNTRDRHEDYDRDDDDDDDDDYDWNNKRPGINAEDIKTITISVGETYKFQNDYGVTTHWSSEDPSFVQVVGISSQGRIKGLKETTTPIKLTRYYYHSRQFLSEEYYVIVGSADVAPEEKTLTINYLYEDGTEAAPTYTQNFVGETNYYVTSPTIAGYVASDTVLFGMVDKDTEINVTYSEEVGDKYACYVYGLIPGKTVDSGEKPDSLWVGLGVVNILGVPAPTRLGPVQGDYRFGGATTALYPDLTFDGETYKYAATGSAEADMEGYYTINLLRVVVADGANAGNNSYNPFVPTGTKAYHADYTIALNTETTAFVNFAVQEPGQTGFNAIEEYAQHVDKNTPESSLRKPPLDTKTFNGKVYHLEGWYKDQGFTQEADFDGNVVTNTTYYGKYVLNPSVTVKYEPGTKGTFETQDFDAQVGANTPTFRGEPVGEAGYEFTGWSPAVSAKVSAAATYVAQWRESLDTHYKVEFYYEKNGAYSDTPDSSDDRTGRTNSTATVTAEDKTPAAGYKYDATNSVTSGTIAGDGSLVLKVFFKQQLTVKFAPGTKGTFKETSTTGLSYGADTPEAPDAENNHKPGYEFTGWTPSLEDTVTKSVTYVAQWRAKNDTPYTVEYYYAVNGEYADVADNSVERGGETDSEASVTAEDKKTARANYKFDANATGNVLSATINGDGSTVLKVYFKEQFTVTYKAGDQGTFEDTVNKELDYGVATPAAPTTDHNPGYTFAGWSPEVAANVTADAEYVATWNANTDTKYTVEYYYQKNGEYGVAENPATRQATTATEVSVTNADKTPIKSGYVFDSNATNVLSGTVAGDGSTVLKVYFKQQFTVKFLRGTHGTFEEIIVNDLDYNAVAPEAPAAETMHDPGYTFAGWNRNNRIESPVKSDAIYVAQWKANEDTPYTVQYFYEKNGEYDFNNPDTTDETRVATTDTTVSIVDADKTPSKTGYVYDAASSTTQAKVNGNGTTVLNVCFKQQFTVTYKPGEHGNFEAQPTKNLAYGTATPAFSGEPVGDAGYEFIGWDVNPIPETVTESATYTAQWRAKTDTKYTVEYYYQKNGEYGAPETDDRTGTTGTTASVTDDDKTPRTGYALDEKAENVLSATINGQGTTTLKLYYKQQFTVTYDNGDFGTFDNQVTSKLDWEAETPAFKGEKTGMPGYEFTGWAPTVADKVTGDVTYVAQWLAKSDTPYTVEFYYQHDGRYDDKPTSSIKRGGTTDAIAVAVDTDKIPMPGYTFDPNAKNVLSAKIEGNGSTVLKVYFKQQLTVTYKPGDHGTFAEKKEESLDYDAKTPAAPNAETEHAPGYTFAGWTPEVADKVTENVVYTATWTANEDTAYTVNYYGYNGDGGWNLLQSKKMEGTTDESVEAIIKSFEGYSFYNGYTGNKVSGKVSGDGSLVLSVYYRVDATVSVVGNTGEAKYNGDWQTVTGYALSSHTTATAPKKAKSADDTIAYDTDKVAETASMNSTAKGKDAGTYYMSLTEDMFRNTDDGFNVNFEIVSDGEIEITTRKVTLTSADATKPFDNTPLTRDEITVTGDGFVEGEGFGYLFTGSQTRIGTSPNTFSYMITEEYQNTNPDNYEVDVVYGTLTVIDAPPVPGTDGGNGPRGVNNMIASGDGYQTVTIDDGKTPLANKMLDANCCILHLLIILAALAIAMVYTRDMKIRQAKIFEYEEELANRGIRF